MSDSITTQIRYFLYKTGTNWHMIPEGTFSITALSGENINLDIDGADDVIQPDEYIKQLSTFSNALRKIQCGEG